MNSEEDLKDIIRKVFSDEFRIHEEVEGIFSFEGEKRKVSLGSTFMEDMENFFKKIEDEEKVNKMRTFKKNGFVKKDGEEKKKGEGEEDEESENGEMTK